MIKMPSPTGAYAIAPSILSANQLILGKQIEEVSKLGVSWLHIDIMDGHFVPNLSFGPSVVKWINTETTLPQDVHLMVEEPEKFIDTFIKAGASSLILHIEAKGDLRSLLIKIKKAGLFCGLSIKPDTNPKVLESFLDLLDIILVMSVYPGFGGQVFLPQSEDQIKATSELIGNRPIWLEVDGGINAQTIGKAQKAGANAFVAGNAIFGTSDMKVAIKSLQEGLKYP